MSNAEQNDKTKLNEGAEGSINASEAVNNQGGAAQLREYEDKRTNKSTGSFNPENYRTFDLTDGDKTISRHNPLKEKDLKPAEKPPAAALKVEHFPGVSKEYLSRVDAIRDRIPVALQKAAEHAGIKIYVYHDAEQLPPVLKEQQARRHKQEETTGHLPAFYEPVNKLLVFVENPRLTGAEKQRKDSFDHGQEVQQKGGVQNFGDNAKIDAKSISYEPIEKIGPHEFGHAVEQVLLQHFAGSKEFEAAFARGAARVKDEREKRELGYFVNPQQVAGHKDFNAAKQEMFAEMFCISLKQPAEQNFRDKLLLKHFPEVSALVAKKVKEVSH